jgi:hypothetical protein
MQDEIVQILPQDGIELSPPLFHVLLEGLMNSHEIERAIFLFRDIRARGISGRLPTYRYMISKCIDAMEGEEAFRLLIDMKDAYGEKSTMEQQWWLILDTCASNGFVRLHYLSG